MRTERLLTRINALLGVSREGVAHPLINGQASRGPRQCGILSLLVASSNDILLSCQVDTCRSYIHVSASCRDCYHDADVRTVLGRYSIPIASTCESLPRPCSVRAVAGNCSDRLVQHALRVDPVLGKALTAELPAGVDDDLDAWDNHKM